SKIPVAEADSTIVYPAKKADGIVAKISFCRKMDKKTGEIIGEGRIFTIMENENVRAFINFENIFFDDNRDLLFHVDWIGPDNKSIYQKRINLSPTDSTSEIYSSISIDPDIRKVGEYFIRLYYFRELIAEKKFELLPEFRLKTENGEAISANITLYRYISKKTGKRIGTDTIFTIKERRNVRAIVDIENSFVYRNPELLFRVEWIDSTGQPFYNKQISFLPDDSVSTIESSISISPDKREAGKYVFRVYLFQELIAESNFELLPEHRLTTIKAKNIKAKVVLYSKKDKETGQRHDEGRVFTIGKKERVRAFINIENRSEFSESKLTFRLEWIGPDGKSFYRKQIDFLPKDNKSTINTSISISPKKREPGEYCLKVYFFNQLMSENKFELR
ncbi:MAG: hypothetical protein U9R19_12605, partial [Bacteroidota bacterium]|nr:hypothetical protein [Bacteroidota bacterium]